MPLRGSGLGLPFVISDLVLSARPLMALLDKDGIAVRFVAFDDSI